MNSRGYAILLWNNNTLVGVYAVVRNMEEADAVCGQLLNKDISYSEYDCVSWMPTFIEDE